MSGFVKNTPLTEEEQEIDAAMDSHIAAAKDERWWTVAGWLGYLIGFPVFLFAPENSMLERIGMAVTLTAILSILVSVVLHGRTRKRHYEAKTLIDAYRRKKAVPFYHELLEVFADKPGIHLHLELDGSITVTDKRNQEERSS